MKPAICVIFLFIWMTHQQFGYCKSQKFFPNGRYGRSDPSMRPLMEYGNNVESLMDDPSETDAQANDNKQLEKSFTSNKLISSLLNNRESKDKLKHLPSSDNFLLCLITTRLNFGDPMKLRCRTVS